MTIVVTGLGAVTVLGKTARATWDAIVRGERGFSHLTLFDPGEVKSRIVAQVPDAWIADSNADTRTSALALTAVREAIADAKLDVGAQRTGLVVGGTTAGMFETESMLATLLSTPVGSAERDAALAKMLSHPLSAPTDFLVRTIGPFTQARSLSSACSSGANAIAIGALWLELGIVDAVVCGGADSLCRTIIAGFSALGAVDPEAARPFDKRRRGLTLGEGAGFVVLERKSSAGAAKRAKCTLLGWSARSEAHHITNPEASGSTPAAAMKAALARAGVSASDVDFVDAHGTGTPLNDPMETHGLQQVFGARLPEVPVSSQKGMIGHTLAAAGAIEAVITAFALMEQMLPPTAGLAPDEVDAECTLRHVFTATPAKLDVAVTSSFGFGGMDTVLVLGRRELEAPSATPKRDVFVHGVAALTPAGLVSGAEAAGIPSMAGGRTVIEIPPDALDPTQARRLDKTSRIGAIVAGAAGARDADTALVLGVAFGAVDATAEFMRRLRDKGARLVKPADFPSLVPSSPAGYVSIYLGLGGPAFVVADLAVSGECAFAQAWELVASGEVERACAAAVEEKSAIVEGALSAIFAGAGAETRGEGGAAITLSASAEGALGRIRGLWSWMGDDVPALPSPPSGAIVVTAGDARPAFWSDCLHVSCAAAGAHEATGAIAIAVAVAKVAAGEAPAAMFYGSARGSSYAGIVLAR